jgi:ABC-type multidrug transport system fused ATPase/permease subunit
LYLRVERVLVYTELPREGALTTKADPAMTWPTQGAISFKNVDLAYRPGLPLVLKGLTFDVKAGEKVGIVGRLAVTSFPDVHGALTSCTEPELAKAR